MTADGVRYLAPHVQLYYKAQKPRQKDEVDLDAVIRSGIRLNSVWLRAAIAHSYGNQHSWLERIPE